MGYDGALDALMQQLRIVVQGSKFNAESVR